MRPLRWLGAGLLWILAGVVGLLGVVFSITVILLPLGLPLLALARRLFGQSMKLVLPRTVTQPGKELKKSVRKKGTKVADAMPEVDAGPVTDRLHEVRRKAGKAVKRSKRQVSF